MSWASLNGSQAEKGLDQGWDPALGQMVIILFVPEGLTLHSCFFTILTRDFKILKTLVIEAGITCNPVLCRRVLV